MSKDYSWAPEVVRDLLVHKDGKLFIRCERCDRLRATSGRKQVIERASESYRQCRQHNRKFQSFDDAEIASWPDGYKRCNSCHELKFLDKFHNHSLCVLGKANQCKECRKPLSKAEWKTKTFEQTMLASSRFRAKKHGIPHTITLDDIVIPEVCPVLGVPIVLERNHKYRPSLDQISPREGYTPENIMVVSHRANHLKLNMTLEEAEKLVAHLKNVSA